MMLVACYYTNDRYKALADRMMASAQRVGLRTIGYFVENPGGEWKSGDAMKPEVVLRAMKENPHDSIFFVDADCVFWSYPVMLDEKTHDYEVAAPFGAIGMAYSTVTWFRAGAGLRYAERWVEEQKKTPHLPNDVGALSAAFRAIRPRRIMHLPATYCWCDELDRHRFGAQKPVIEHFAVGEHSFGGNAYTRTKHCIF